MTTRLAFFCSNACPGDIILKAQDWANGLTDINPSIMSGFHTAIEKDVLRILLRNQTPIVYTLARSSDGARLPRAVREGEKNGHVEVVSPFSKAHKRTTAQSAQQRNEYILSRVDGVLIAHASIGGKTEWLAGEAMRQGVSVFTFASEHNENVLSLGATPLVN